ncbi:MAG TPA: hypothetical protein VN644_17565, partial [Pyrinomonadaceae bacterium]|nr:hypothetical protein [Pyrinomonadaceae bacterium]
MSALVPKVTRELTKMRRTLRETLVDIEKQLDLGKLQVVKTGIYRPNLQLEVRRVTNEREKHEQLIRILNEHEGTGIIYAAT